MGRLICSMNQGVTKKRKLWSKAGEKMLRELPLKPWASRCHFRIYPLFTPLW